MAGRPDSPSSGAGAVGEPAEVPEFTPIARHYLLLPFERLVARRFFEHRYSTPELRKSPTTVQNGPVALVLMGAMYAWGVPGWLLGISGLAALVLSGGASYAHWMIGVGIAMIVVALLRGMPALAAMKLYQAERGQRPPPTTSG
jgi:hypothetical protein